MSATRWRVACNKCGTTDLALVGFAAMKANGGLTACCSTAADWEPTPPDTVERAADANLGANESLLTSPADSRILAEPTTTKEEQ